MLATDQVSLLNEQIDSLVERAPVMMHVVGYQSKIVKVNRRWLNTMGYLKEEVVGRPWTEFLTVESRARIVARVLPVWGQLGKARSVGADFVRRDSRVIHRLFDSDYDGTIGGKGFRYSAIFDPSQDRQWALATTALAAIVEIIRIRGSVASNAPDISSLWRIAPEIGADNVDLVEAQGEPTRLTKKELKVLACLAMAKFRYYL